MPLAKESDLGSEGEEQLEPQDKLMPRITEADQKNDQRSLNRLLHRTLYLVVQNAKGDWTFPEDLNVARESLAQVRRSNTSIDYTS